MAPGKWNPVTQAGMQDSALSGGAQRCYTEVETPRSDPSMGIQGQTLSFQYIVAD